MAAGGTGGTDLFAAGGLLAGVVEVPAGAVGAEGADEAELVPFGLPRVFRTDELVLFYAAAC